MPVADPMDFLEALQFDIRARDIISQRLLVHALSF